MSQNPPENVIEVASHALFGWVACSDRLPEDFETVFMRGRDLGCFTGSRRAGKWRVYTPLNAADGRRIMIEDLPSPEYWMPIPSLPNSKDSHPKLGES